MNMESSGLEARARSTEANSGAAFVRRLGLNTDAANAKKLQTFAWNVGRCNSFVFSPAPLSFAQIVTRTELISLVQTYFEKFHPFYGFIDLDHFMARLRAKLEASGPNEPFDAVICGVAALGYLFSQREGCLSEANFIEIARVTIECHSKSGYPSVDTVTALLLRVAYLRMTDTPYPAWMASCALMHMIEITGLHVELPPKNIFPQVTEYCEPDIRRRLLGIAQHLHLWMAFELGQSEVQIQGACLAIPLPSSGDYTGEVLSLLSLSSSLSPEQSKEPQELEASILKVLSGNYTHPASTIAQCNLALCIYRRLRVLHREPTQQVHQQLLDLMTKSLALARELIASCCPWHGTTTVSFQIICTLLAMDTYDTISHVEDAMNTLRIMLSVYHTDVMQESYSVACVLLMMQYRRKETDLHSLKKVVLAHSALAMDRSTPVLEAQILTESSGPSWVGDLVTDIPGLDAFDLEQFFNSELPLLRERVCSQGQGE